MAVLDFNLGLLLEIFFLILVGMILGLTLISLNLQRSLELLLVHVLLFLETKSMKILILKNLSAHRESNRLTSIIYSLTLGCIIFVIVASNLQISLFTSTTQYGMIDMTIGAGNENLLISHIDPILKEYEYAIEKFAYITAPILE